MSIELQCPQCQRFISVEPAPFSAVPCPVCQFDLSATIARLAMPAAPQPFGGPPPMPQAQPIETAPAFKIELKTDTGSKLASPGKRVLGRLVDALVIGASQAALVMIGIQLHYPGQSLLEVPRMFVFLYLALGVIPAFVLQMLLYAARGRSFGKLLAGTRIVTLDNQPADLFRGYVAREAIMIVPAFVPVFNVIFGLCDALWLINKDRRCIHDLIVETKVIEQ